MIEWLHPGLLLIAAALGVPFFRGAARKVFVLSAAGIALADCLLMRPGTYAVFRFLDHTLTAGRVDRLSIVFADVFSLIAFIGLIYALHVDDWKQHTAALIYAGSALGAVFAGDLVVLYFFWELMALSSVFLVLLARNEKSTAAALRYLLVHLFGGVLLLGGIILRVRETGTVAFGNLSADPAGSGLSFSLILAGFLLNAAAPPLSAWLPDAYPEGTVTGTVFLSAFTTKTAVYVLARGFPGTELLVWLGAVMTLYGIVYAVLENDIRRLLAYHIISQVGYMVCGIGLGTVTALNGAVAHAFAHILYKALLLMGAGSILMTGRR
jgi:multicomponent Na+:H+ antiporter subunit D